MGVKVVERIRALGLPNAVETKAYQIYDSLPTAIRNSKRINQIVNLVVTESYKSLHVVYNASKLAKTLNVKRPHDILKEAARHGYMPILCHYQPVDFIRDYMHKIGIKMEHFDEIHSLIAKVMDTSPYLEEKTPQSVAAGVVLEYAMINGYSVNNAEFAKDINVSLNIIKNRKMAVAIAYAV